MNLGQDIVDYKINEIRDKIDLEAESMKFQIDEQRIKLFEKLNTIKDKKKEASCKRFKSFFYYSNLKRTKTKSITENFVRIFKLKLIKN